MVASRAAASRDVLPLKILESIEQWLLSVTDLCGAVSLHLYAPLSTDADTGFRFEIAARRSIRPARRWRSRPHAGRGGPRCNPPRAVRLGRESVSSRVVGRGC